MNMNFHNLVHPIIDAPLLLKLWMKEWTNAQYRPFKIFWLLSPSKSKCKFCHWSKMTLKLSSYLLQKFCRVPFTVILILLISTMVIWHSAKLWLETWRWFKGHFWSMSKVALRFGWAKQSKNLEWFLLCMPQKQRNPSFWII
jgi:hypothetical protein